MQSLRNTFSLNLKMASLRENITKIFDLSQEPCFEIDHGIQNLRALLSQAPIGEKVSSTFNFLIFNCLFCLRIYFQLILQTQLFDALKFFWYQIMHLDPIWS